MQDYSLRSQIMHAIIAVTVLSLMLIGMLLTLLPNSFYFWHKSFGLLVLFLMPVRIYFIIKDGRPALPSNIANLEKVLARSVQFFFYIALIVMPLSGWIMSTADGYIPSFFGINNFAFPCIVKDANIARYFKQAHFYVAWLIGGLIILHMLGNLKNMFIHKNEVLSRMWKLKKTRN